MQYQRSWQSQPRGLTPQPLHKCVLFGFEPPENLLEIFNAFYYIMSRCRLKSDIHSEQMVQCQDTDSLAAAREPLLKLSPESWLGTRRLLFFHEIPSWQQDNEYLLSGYRPTSASVWSSVASLFYLHNQTINAYSHLIGCVTFIALPLHFYYTYNGLPKDVLVISIYCLGAAICFAFSSTFHILWNHSEHLNSFWNKLDYLGIVALMWGAGIPTIYYGFWCDPHLRYLYWSSTTATAVACAIFTLNPHFSKPRFRHWRAPFYASFELSSIVFVIHGLLIHRWELQKSRMSLVWMGCMATSNLVGAVLYAAKIPERWWPKTFDIFGASHQLFHVAVMIAACIHYVEFLEAFRVIHSAQHMCT